MIMLVLSDGSRKEFTAEVMLDAYIDRNSMYAESGWYATAPRRVGGHIETKVIRSTCRHHRSGHTVKTDKAR